VKQRPSPPASALKAGAEPTPGSQRPRRRWIAAAGFLLAALAAGAAARARNPAGCLRIDRRVADGDDRASSPCSRLNLFRAAGALGVGQGPFGGATRRPGWPRPRLARPAALSPRSAPAGIPRLLRVDGRNGHDGRQLFAARSTSGSRGCWPADLYARAAPAGSTAQFFGRGTWSGCSPIRRSRRCTVFRASVPIVARSGPRPPVVLIARVIGPRASRGNRLAADRPHRVCGGGRRRYRSGSRKRVGRRVSHVGAGHRRCGLPIGPATGVFPSRSPACGATTYARGRQHRDRCERTTSGSRAMPRAPTPRCGSRAGVSPRAAGTAADRAGWMRRPRSSASRARSARSACACSIETFSVT